MSERSGDTTSINETKQKRFQEAFYKTGLDAEWLRRVAPNQLKAR